jgi:hypothetical protein
MAEHRSLRHHILRPWSVPEPRLEPVPERRVSEHFALGDGLDRHSTGQDQNVTSDPPAYVSSVDADVVSVSIGSRHRRHAYGSESELATLLMQLRDEGIPFLDVDQGWPPGAVFADLRERGLVDGAYCPIAWYGPADWRVWPER